MEQFWKILKFELKNYLTNKTFVGITTLLVVVIAIVMCFPRIMEFTNQNEQKTPEFSNTEEGNTTENLPILLIASYEEETNEMVKEAFTQAFPDYTIQITENNIDSIKNQITSGKAECAFLFDSLTSYTYYVETLSMHDSNTVIANEVLQTVYRMHVMLESGLSLEEANTILTISIESKTENFGKDQIQNFFYTYIMIFALYMVILLYGQMIATNVATEKSSRAMELLITSAKPTSMMFGKVLSSCIAGFLQITAVFGSALFFYHWNKMYWNDNTIIQSIFDMPIDLFLYMLLFFVLGFFIYAFLYGAVGSTASKLEDINTSVMPITLLFIIGFFIVIFSMTNGNVNSPLMKVCSFVPFTSPMAMFTRIAMTTVPLYQILISVGILFVSVIGIGILSAKIYRVGVLLYGTTPKPIDLLKAAWNA